MIITVIFAIIILVVYLMSKLVFPCPENVERSMIDFKCNVCNSDAYVYFNGSCRLNDKLCTIDKSYNKTTM